MFGDGYARLPTNVWRDFDAPRHQSSSYLNGKEHTFLIPACDIACTYSWQPLFYRGYHYYGTAILSS
jgi:hypothetical protein